MTDEEWKLSPYPPYQVSSLGRVRNRTGRLLRPATTKGYQHVTIYHDGRRFTGKIHRLVCETWHGPKPEGKGALHRNGDSLDNRPENLYWGTVSENALDRSRDGRHHQNRAEKNGQAKLSWETVRAMREGALQGLRYTEIAAKFTLPKATVVGIVTNKSWVDPDYTPQPRRRGPRPGTRVERPTRALD